MGNQSPYNKQFQAAVIALNNANGQLFQLHQTYDEVLSKLRRLPSDEKLASVLATLSWCRRHGTHQQFISEECEAIEQWHPGFTVMWIQEVSSFVLLPRHPLDVCPRCSGTRKVDYRKPLLGDTWEQVPCSICQVPDGTQTWP